MPRSGSGSYTIPTTLVAGNTALASEVMGNFNDLGSEIADSLSRSGKGGMVADLDMGNNKVTDLAEPVASSDAATKNYVDGLPVYGAEFLVAASHSSLSGERVATDTATITWDFSTASQAKANVPDNAITLAKLEDGTQGDLLYYGASGAPERLGAGTNGQVLTTQGAAANPAYAWEHVVQTVLTESNAATVITGTIPFDDTSPAIGEGTQVFSQAITPKDAAHKINVFCHISFGATGGAGAFNHAFAVFRGNATLGVFVVTNVDNNAMQSISFMFQDTPGVTTSTTYSVRHGSDTSVTTRLNGDGAGRLFGGSAVSSMMLQEIR